MTPATVGVETGWVVCEYVYFDVDATDLSTSFPFLHGSFKQRDIPDPSVIFGKCASNVC